MKKYIGWIILVLVIIGLIVVAAVFSENDSDYFVDVDMTEVLDKMDNKDTFMLYIKQTDCAHCKEFTPIFRGVLREYNLHAYTLNLTNLDDDNMDLYKEYFDVDGTPCVLFFDRGEQSLIEINGTASKSKVISKLKSVNFIKESNK